MVKLFIEYDSTAPKKILQKQHSFEIDIDVIATTYIVF